MCINSIVEILKEGSVGAFDPNQKLDKKPDVVGYYPFTKTVEVDGKLVTALLKIEQKAKGEFVYHLRTSSDSTLDSAHENASLLRFMPDSLAFRGLAEPTLDAIVEPNTGGVNIIILKVTDLEGNEIKELEDSVDDFEIPNDATSTLNGFSVSETINELNTEYGTDNDVWNASVAEVQALSESDYQNLIDALENANYGGELVILKATKNGDSKLIDAAKELAIEHSKKGRMSSVMIYKRSVLDYAAEGNYDRIKEVMDRAKRYLNSDNKDDVADGNEILEFIKTISPEPTPIEPVENTIAPQGIDPVAKANIEATNISGAIKKKAIAYLNANPSSHKLFEKETPAGKKAYVAIMENLKTALFAEVNALNPLFRAYQNYTTMTLRGKDNERLVGFTVKVDENYKMTFGVNDYSGSTENTEIEVYKNIFDSTSTIEELRQWGFTLPFDLDVKAFVANVIKPVVDEFLAKTEPETENVGQNEAVELGVDDTRKKIEDEIAHLEEVVKTGFDNGKRLVPTSVRNKGFALNDAQKRLNKFNEQNPPPVSAGIAALQELAKLADKSSEPTPPETESNETVQDLEVQPPQNATAEIDAEIESLRGLIGTKEFSDALDNLLDKLEAAGLDSDYEQIVTEIIKLDAQAENAKISTGA